MDLDKTKKDIETIGTQLRVPLEHVMSSTIDMERYVKRELAMNLANHILDNIEILPIEYHKQQSDGYFTYMLSMNLIDGEMLKLLRRAQQLNLILF